MSSTMACAPSLWVSSCARRRRKWGMPVSRCAARSSRRSSTNTAKTPRSTAAGLAASRLNRQQAVWPQRQAMRCDETLCQMGCYTGQSLSCSQAGWGIHFANCGRALGVPRFTGLERAHYEALYTTWAPEMAIFCARRGTTVWMVCAPRVGCKPFS